jgi:hypothetical protein
MISSTPKMIAAPAMTTSRQTDITASPGSVA